MRNKQEPTEKWKPSKEDIEKLRIGMGRFSRAKVQDRWWYPFEQYCRSLGVITDGADGQIVVRAPEAWRQLNDTYDFLKWQQQKDQELYFQANPEAEAEYNERLKAFFTDFRKILTNVTTKE